MSYLEIRDLNKKYSDTVALRNISFSMEQGETLSIIGSSGSGKTTLLRCLNGLETYDRGEIILEGKSLQKGNKGFSERPFGLVFQNFQLFPQYTALENVTLALKLKKTASVKEIEEKGLSLLKKMGLGNRWDYYPCELSGGQQQRVAIARAMALGPQVLCFDEPTSALDPELTNEVLKVIEELSREKMTLIIVTHEISFAESVSDHILFMDEGSIVEEGGREMISHPRNKRTKEFLRNYR